VGRGLSNLQKAILKEAERNGCIEAFEAQRIVFDLLPKRKQKIPSTSSARPKHVWFLRLRRILTPSEKRDASVAASASRSLARLCKRGLLTHSAKRKYYPATGWPPLTDSQAQENAA
jgi:hypothetical protein